jgi:hypothetical protein
MRRTVICDIEVSQEDRFYALDKVTTFGQGAWGASHIRQQLAFVFVTGGSGTLPKASSRIGNINGQE